MDDEDDDYGDEIDLDDDVDAALKTRAFTNLCEQLGLNPRRLLVAAGRQLDVAHQTAQEHAYQAGQACGFPCLRTGQFDSYCYCRRRGDEDARAAAATAQDEAPAIRDTHLHRGSPVCRTSTPIRHL